MSSEHVIIAKAAENTTGYESQSVEALAVVAEKTHHLTLTNTQYVPGRGLEKIHKVDCFLSSSIYMYIHNA